jgi:hypothetical protein
LTQDLRRVIGFSSGTALIVGITIGSGIFRTPPTVAGLVPSAPIIMALWVAFGIISICGALTVAELSSMLPHGRGLRFLREGYATSGFCPADPRARHHTGDDAGAGHGLRGTVLNPASHTSSLTVQAIERRDRHAHLATHSAPESWGGQRSDHCRRAALAIFSERSCWGREARRTF